MKKVTPRLTAVTPLGMDFAATLSPNPQHFIHQHFNRARRRRIFRQSNLRMRNASSPVIAVLRVARTSDGNSGSPLVMSASAAISFNRGSPYENSQRNRFVEAGPLISRLLRSPVRNSCSHTIRDSLALPATHTLLLRTKFDGLRPPYEQPQVHIDDAEQFECVRKPGW